MKIDNTAIKSLSVKVFREKGKSSTDEIHVDVTIETSLANAKIKKFSSKDLHSLIARNEEKTEIVKLLKLNVFLIPEPNIAIASEVIHKVSDKIIIKKSNGDIFEFNDDENSIFIIEASIEDATRPEGTKRKVITYEDSDIIDQSVSY